MYGALMKITYILPSTLKTYTLKNLKKLTAHTLTLIPTAELVVVATTTTIYELLTATTGDIVAI